MRVDAMKLKLLSAENGMNVQELADVSGVAFATVCKARAGKEVSERTIVKLARALQVDAVELIEQDSNSMGIVKNIYLSGAKH